VAETGKCAFDNTERDIGLTLTSSGLILGARLKALEVDFVIVEKNAKAGDNWANRYDSMRFHVYKTACHTPYIRKSKLYSSGMSFYS
jgi:cation diffusion facilitator CzcD-associated flavoprotein CzcO